MYEAMYGYYSKDIHGTLALKNYVCLDEPAFKVKKFRVPSMVHILCEQNLVIFSQIYNKIVEKYLEKEHEEDFDRWYFQKKEQLKVILEAEKNINKFK